MTLAEQYMSGDGAYVVLVTETFWKDLKRGTGGDVFIVALYDREEH